MGCPRIKIRIDLTDRFLGLDNPIDRFSSDLIDWSIVSRTIEWINRSICWSISDRPIPIDGSILAIGPRPETQNGMKSRWKLWAFSRKPRVVAVGVCSACYSLHLHHFRPRGRRCQGVLSLPSPADWLFCCFAPSHLFWVHFWARCLAFCRHSLFVFFTEISFFFSYFVSYCCSWRWKRPNVFHVSGHVISLGVESLKLRQARRLEFHSLSGVSGV